MCRIAGCVALIALFGGASFARAGSVTIVAAELKDGAPILDAGTQTFSVFLTTKAGPFFAVLEPGQPPRLSDPRLTLTFTAPSTFRLAYPNDLIPAGTEVDMTVEARLSGRLPALALPGVIAKADSSLTIAFPELPTVCPWNLCPPNRVCETKYNQRRSLLGRCR